MTEQKRQDPTSKKQEEKMGSEDADLDQNKQIEVSTTQAPMHNENMIKPVIMRDHGTTNTTATTNFHAMTDEEETLTTKVRIAGDALYGMVMLAIDKAKRKSVEKAKEIATRDVSPAAIAGRKDAHDITALGDSVEGLARTFESLMTEIRKQPYSEQVHLLTGYKKLLKEQISVVDSRIHMAKRLR
jgi:hypothetical protein